MKVSQFPISTLRETPADAEIISHQLMLKAGLIRRLASGLYTWAPYGLKVLRKVENIIREEMNKAGAIELLMPSVQPAELWEESHRWNEYGAELLRIKDRHGRDFCYGPTHEEIITDYVRKELKSYKELPVNYYQIQTKFRDEVRPRFGVMRAREFLMKDAYSFHLSQESLQQTYDLMFKTYCRIFERLGLEYRPVDADTGSIGGSASNEFHVLADSGEDAIAFSSESGYAANVELAEAISLIAERAEPSEEIREVDTPDAKTIDELVEQFNQPIDKTVKTLIVAAAEDQESDFIALLVRGDHTLNEIKAEKLPQVASPLCFATDEEIRNTIGAGPGSLGPINMPLPCIVDRTVANLSDFSAGANIDGKHLFGINWERDIATPQVADIRNVIEGDPSPDGQGTLTILRGIEVGHIFQLGTKYSSALNATVLNENGKSEVVTMGCYGIGVSRVVAASIEQNFDEQGIVWPEALAPFQISLVPLNYHKSEEVKEVSDKLYRDLLAAGYDILLDDRNMRAGAMFSDHELLGIPHRIVISERGLKQGELEYKARTGSDAEKIPVDQIMSFVTDTI